MKTNVSIAKSELKMLVDYVSDKNRTKSELTEIIMEIPEIFGKKLLEVKSIFGLKKLMVDKLNQVTPNDAKPVVKTETKPAVKTASKPAEKIETRDEQIRRIVMDNGLSNVQKADEILKILNGETKPASKPVEKPAVKTASKPVKTTKKSGNVKMTKNGVMQSYVESLNGEYFCKEDLVNELDAIFGEDDANALTAGAFLTGKDKWLLKNNEVEVLKQDGVKWYAIV